MVSAFPKVRVKSGSGVRTAQDCFWLLFLVSAWCVCGPPLSLCLPGQDDRAFHFSVTSPHSCPWFVS